ncbi:MAG: NAD-dependent epimerase/dehydratase family protein [Phaeovulum sp.]|uniref:NAD-dependent epimerase/dehydratase family protein n=1 Tax=Phaeovulum sp. TaxID=2934796 RepID=UPI00272F5241|nr:NAD-dependent epimerase/dehydratase family protein [Phaeovulum sp.]MDP2061835.1 NAD-dependent epimerase/dehydratase family protein [Phaeovulum sp.]
MTSTWSGLRVVVAGGAGFIGCSLVPALLAAGARVRVVDDLSTGQAAGLDGAEIVVADIAALTELPGGAADVVFNLACPASPRAYQADPVRTWRSSVLGTHALALAALAVGARLVQASTSEVYGDPDVHPQVESYAGNVSLQGPRACYDEGKRAAEVLLYDLGRTQGLDVRVARIFNTYGPGMALGDGRALPEFIEAALVDAPLRLEGSGRQTRSFCHVDDMVRGLMALAACEAARGIPVNLGNPDERTIRAAAEAVIRLSGSRSVLIDVPAARDDPRRRCPDISRAKALLGWEPEVGFEAGLAMMIADLTARKRLATAGGSR